jgi:lysophospholipase L1-like esterase
MGFWQPRAGVYSPLGIRWLIVRKVFKYLLLATVPAVLVLLIGEGVARLWPGDFTVQRTVFIPLGHEEYFGTQRVFLPYEARAPYYWLPVAKTPLTNSRGFRGAEVAEPKAVGNVRVVCLGCSCTLGGQEPYPQRLERLLTEALGTKKYEVVNAGVGSSSTYQGLQLLQKHVLELQPDVVTVFFGWNDRWVHDGRRDAQHRLPSAAEQRLVAWLSHSRFVKALIFLADRWRGQQPEQRVPAAEYAANLQQIVRLCRERGIRVLLCTTPDGMTPQAIEHRFLRDNNAVNRTRELYALFKDKGATPTDVWNYIQRLYNQQVQTVAEMDRVELVDLDREIAARRLQYPAANLRFYKDGIHFTELGLQEVARLLALQVVDRSEQEAVRRYLESPVYYRSNAARFSIGPRR